GGRRLAELLRDPGFQVLRAEEAGDRVRVYVKDAGRVFNSLNIQSEGVIEFEPSASWAVRAYEYSAKGGSFKLTYKNEFSDQQYDGYRPLTHCTITTSAPHGTT